VAEKGSMLESMKNYQLGGVSPAKITPLFLMSAGRLTLLQVYPSPLFLSVPGRRAIQKEEG